MYPTGDDWEQTALLAWSNIAPHSKHPPRIEDFLPPAMQAELKLSRAQTPAEIFAVLKGRQ